MVCAERIWTADFWERIFVCVCLVCPVSLKLTTVARYGGRMESINLVGDLSRGGWCRSGDFTSWSVLHNVFYQGSISHLRVLNLVSISVCQNRTCSLFSVWVNLHGAPWYCSLVSLSSSQEHFNFVSWYLQSKVSWCRFLFYLIFLSRLWSGKFQQHGWNWHYNI